MVRRINLDTSTQILFMTMIDIRHLETLQAMRDTHSLVDTAV